MQKADKTKRMSLLIVGVGNMGAAIASAIEKKLPFVDITAVDPDMQRATKLLPSKTTIKLCSDISAIGDVKFDICILAVKPQQIADSLQRATFNLRTSLVISIAAGIGLKAIANAAPSASRFVRVMPNLPAMVQQAMSVGYHDEKLSCTDRETVELLFQAIGQFLWLTSEDQIDLATGLTGSGPGYVFAFTEHLQLSASRLGFSEEIAEKFARQVIIGAARVLERDPRSAHELKVAVTSPGGTTAAGLTIFEDPAAIPSILPATIAAAAARACELSGILPRILNSP